MLLRLFIRTWPLKSSLVREFHNAFATNVKPKVQIPQKTFARTIQPGFFAAGWDNFGGFVLAEQSRM